MLTPRETAPEPSICLGPSMTTETRVKPSFDSDSQPSAISFDDAAQPCPPSTIRKDHIETALRVISQVLKAATAATSFFPPLQSVVGGVANAMDMAKVSHQNRIDRETVKKALREASKRIEKCSDCQILSPEMIDLVMKLQSDLSADIGSIDEAMSDCWWKRLVEGDAQALNKHYAKLSSMLGVFISQTVIGVDGHVEALRKITAELKLLTEKNREAISQLRATVELKELNCVPEAGYDAGPPNLRRACTLETRKQILTDLMAWATDDTNTQVYWLSGMAGTGKTTIAYSFCELLEEADLLLTSFFCSRTVTASMDPRALLPSLAYHLASYSPPFSQSLFSALQNPSNANIRQKELEKQFNALILGPTGVSLKSQSRKHRVLVYDGADEASNLDEVAKLISLLLDHAGDLPFKVFISSRREALIKQEFGRKDIAVRPTALLLHDIEKSLVETDIRRYMRERLHRVSHLLSEPSLDVLVERSGTLFVYASVLCSFLDKRSEDEVQARLEAILANSPAPIGGTRARPHDNVDQIYNQILSTAENISTDIWPVLLVILTTRNPLTAASISNILGFDRDFRVLNVIETLHSVLTGSDANNTPVTIFHSSFRDFLSDKSRGGRFCDLISACHYVLAKRSLQIMKENLVSDNICKVTKNNIRKARVKVQRYISTELGYACMTCFSHLTELGQAQLLLLREDILGCFDHLILRWIECMAWLDQLEHAEISLQRAEVHEALSPDLRFAAGDARQVILQCSIIKAFPLEVYRSALVWLPKSSRIRQQFQYHDWKVTCGLPETWDKGTYEPLENDALGNFVLCIAFSDDGKWVVAGSTDMTVRVWDVEKGQEKWKFDGHTGHVQSVTFSPDGRRVISGSDDKTVRIWSLETGEEERRLEGHSRSVRSISISPDGRKVASGADDAKVRIWDVSTGKADRMFDGHSGDVHFVSFSHHGTKVVSGSSMDQTVRIWDVETGEQKEMKGSPGRLSSLFFSKHDKRVVAISDSSSAKIWNAETGEVMPLKKRHRTIQAAISHHRRDLTSGTISSIEGESTLSRIWIPRQFRYFENVVAFSPQAICYAKSDRLFIVRSAHILQPYTFTI